MGYFTNFSFIKIQGSDEDWLNCARDILEAAGESVGKDPVGAIEEGFKTKWYDFDKDMPRIARKYPDLIIEVDGEGEEFPDIWTSRYHCDREEHHSRYATLAFREIVSDEERQMRADYLAHEVKELRGNIITMLTDEVLHKGTDDGHLTVSLPIATGTDDPHVLVEDIRDDEVPYELVKVYGLEVKLPSPEAGRRENELFIETEDGFFHPSDLFTDHLQDIYNRVAMMSEEDIRSAKEWRDQ